MPHERSGWGRGLWLHDDVNCFFTFIVQNPFWLTHKAKKRYLWCTGGVGTSLCWLNASQVKPSFYSLGESPHRKQDFIVLKSNAEANYETSLYSSYHLEIYLAARNNNNRIFIVLNRYPYFAFEKNKGYTASHNLVLYLSTFINSFIVKTNYKPTILGLITLAFKQFLHKNHFSLVVITLQFIPLTGPPKDDS